MGTFFTPGATKDDVVEELIEPLKSGGHLVDSKRTMEDGEPILWTVEKGEKDGVPYQFIGCYILRESNDGDWGYKPMDETMGPCFYSVPLEWLDKYPCIVPGGKGFSEKWRKSVVAHRISHCFGGKGG